MRLTWLQQVQMSSHIYLKTHHNVRRFFGRFSLLTWPVSSTSHVLVHTSTLRQRHIFICQITLSQLYYVIFYCNKSPETPWRRVVSIMLPSRSCEPSPFSKSAAPPCSHDNLHAPQRKRNKRKDADTVTNNGRKTKRRCFHWRRTTLHLTKRPH